MVSGKVYYKKVSDPQPNYLVYLSDSKGNRFSMNSSNASITNGSGIFTIQSTDGAGYLTLKCGSKPIVKKIGSNKLINFDLDNCESVELDEVVITGVQNNSSNNSPSSSDNENANTNTGDEGLNSNPKNTNQKKSFKDLAKKQKLAVYTAGLGGLGLLASLFIKK